MKGNRLTVTKVLRPALGTTSPFLDPKVRLWYPGGINAAPRASVPSSNILAVGALTSPLVPVVDWAFDILVANSKQATSRVKGLFMT